ncbi:Rhs element Vgr protein [Aquimarina amphilecti]|uniref:Rhs element Vgr protein n=1 Tax=Aquimarina amphilecti TaxID=1038014 RepID=A0A1H7X919_AQUAM|nr:phage baseplate assembly protein V [Aquimarina amphilecti]SEM29549.1 Rhs element Vgr protein [Aquimarina amphilecti]
MALQSNIQIFIGGVSIKAFKKLTLKQEIDDHHSLEILCRKDVLEKVSDLYEDESNDFLGQTIILSISSLDSVNVYKELKFNGVVTEVKVTNGFHQSMGDSILIKAKSNSILTDDGPHYASFSDENLTSILTDVFQKYDRSKLNTTITTRFNNPLHYCVQQGESSFQFASRLSAQYGEWFYYDGENLIFGEPQNSEEVALTYGFDLQEFSRRLQPRSNSYSFFTNDYLSNEKHEVGTSEITSSINGHNGFASNKSKEMFPHKTQVFLNTFNDTQTKQRLGNLVKEQKKAEEIKQVIITGKSDNPGVSLGRIVKIKEKNNDQGVYRIIKITHTATENGKYINLFEGIAIDQDVYPNTNIFRTPKSETQVATVTANDDPEGIGRIKVQLNWQKPLGVYTPWLRVMTPHSGGDKGFHFIPEVGEEVLIGFEGGNAERPFVLGALYNGSANPSGWKTDKNNVKAIRTRSGHTIELNDTDKAEFITIKDKNENLIHIDTANNNITITALETMTLNAKNFEMNVKEDASFNIGRDTTIYTERNFDTSSSNHTNTVESKMKNTIGGDLIQNSGNAEIQSKRNMKIACGATASFQGGGNVKISKG